MTDQDQQARELFGSYLKTLGNDEGITLTFNFDDLLVGANASTARPAWSGIAKAVSLFASKRTQQSFLGDLEERYAALTKTKGRQAASRWFWRELIHSFISLAFDALKRLSGLEKLLRRIGS